MGSQRCSQIVKTHSHVVSHQQQSARLALPPSPQPCLQPLQPPTPDPPLARLLTPSGIRHSVAARSLLRSPQRSPQRSPRRASHRRSSDFRSVRGGWRRASSLRAWGRVSLLQPSRSLNAAISRYPRTMSALKGDPWPGCLTWTCRPCYCPYGWNSGGSGGCRGAPPGPQASMACAQPLPRHRPSTPGL